MDHSLAYHLEEGDGTVLSLQFANPDKEIVEQQLRDLRQNLSPAVQDFYAEITTDTFDQDVHALYTAEVYPREFVGYEAITGDGNEILRDTIIDAFQEIEAECRAAGNPLRWYKQPELDMIVETINQTEWQQPIPDVAGCLLSNLITAHGLPNANHRTALSFVQVYLRSYAPKFVIPETGITGEWYDWAEAFVRESKRLLTLSRKCHLFRYLRHWGCDGVVRKDEATLRFENYALDAENPLAHFRQQHRELSMEFVYEILERTEENALIAREDQGRSVFIDRLTASQ